MKTLHSTTSTTMYYYVHVTDSDNDVDDSLEKKIIPTQINYEVEANEHHHANILSTNVSNLS